MENTQRKRIFLRIPLIITIFIVLCSKCANETGLPVAVFKFWDFIFTAICAFFMVFLFTSMPNKENENFVSGLIIALISSQCACFVGNALFGTIMCLIGCLIVCLIFGLKLLAKFISSEKNWINFGHWLIGQ